MILSNPFLRRLRMQMNRYCLRFARVVLITQIVVLVALMAGLGGGLPALAQTSDSDAIPAVAWRIPMGVAPAHPGGHRPEITTLIDDGYWQGAPVGGIGAGTFSESYRGKFERWHMKAGVHKYQDVPANQFAAFAQPEGGKPVAVALSVGKPANGTLSAWNWGLPAGDGEYAALYPKSWFSYGNKMLPVKLTVEQFSPVLPDNYKETSYPVAEYRWTAENPTDKPMTVSVLFSWTNMVGWFRDALPTMNGALNHQNIDRFVTEKTATGSAAGIVFDRLRSGPVEDDWDGQFAIAAEAGKGVEVSYLGTYDPTGTGAEVWEPFAKDGRLPNVDARIASSGQPMAGAIAVRFTLAAHERRVVPMALSWDLPIVQFGGGRKWVKHYTKFYGSKGTNAWELAKTALENQETWSKAIDAWQKPVISDESKPAWYRAELFNELYYLADGGSVWGHEKDGLGNPAHKSAKDADSFSYMECFDYSYYGTSDVRFNASFPLLRFWPELEKQEMREYTDTIAEANPQKYEWLWKSLREHKLVEFTRKTAGAAPHDLGAPGEDPFVNANQYNYQDVSNWRDLNSKYVLMIWRDYALTGAKDAAFLRYSWPAVKQAMEHLKQYDTDGDGLIENGGFPDQTYDDWTATGESAYSGSLYLAALKATEKIAGKMGDSATASTYAALFTKAQGAFEKKLWNGSYFNYDMKSQHKDAIQAEQLAGQWYADLTGLGALVPPEQSKSALKKVYDFNVMKFNGGEAGAINGIGSDGALLHDNPQLEEVWTGSTFSVASTMIAEGLKDEGFATAKGINNVVWRDKGYFFRTPEAYDVNGMYRASMYMRPTAIWAMEYALEKK
jgi:non-lysosomal glucosylceramidase